MKKLFTILFTVFYLLVSAGILVNIHYCHGQIANIKVFSDKENCCCSTNMEDTGCCINVTILLQIDDDQQASHNITLPNNQTYSAVLKSLHLLKDNSFIITEDQFWLIDIPPPENIPIYILNCSFTFYG